jgi:AAA+ superfamily predicted ATPase
MNKPPRHVERLQRAIEAVGTMLERYAKLRQRTVMPSEAAGLPALDLGPTEEGSALDALAGWFSLTPFEVGVVVLAAAMEASPEIANLCALAQGDPALPFPTSLLALAVLGGLDGASQAAFSPSAPLRFWQLITTQNTALGGRLFLQIGAPDAVFQFLIGQPVLDEQLSALIAPLERDLLLPADVAFAASLTRLLAAGDDAIIQIVTPPTRRAFAVAAAVAAGTGRRLFHLPLERLTTFTERQSFSRLWQRDRLALRGMLVVSFEEPPAEFRLAALSRLITEESGPLILLGAGGQNIGERAQRAIVRVPLPPIEVMEVAEHLAHELGLDTKPPPELIQTADRFRLPLATLDSCAAIATMKAEETATPPSLDAVLPHLLGLLRDQVREAMSGLADRLTVRMTLDDLILPGAAKSVLLQIVARQRNRGIVFDEWGFRFAGGGAQGMSVLFSGPSGTGKTMAAEVLANALGLDLYRVDLARIVDKYIGETEKRLANLFDSADASDAILLFDEADVLFGRRTEVRDSHDRYANLEVGYLLQRIECFRGIAILTTNLPSAIDEAFARRFAFSLQFEFPSRTERREIWQKAIPPQAPTQNLDWDQLSKLSLSGGQIRVIIINAAMLAADEHAAIGMPHIAKALAAEYAKQRRPMPVTDLAGWRL